jgi:hypothetical protein
VTHGTHHEHLPSVQVIPIDKPLLLVFPRLEKVR